MCENGPTYGTRRVNPNLCFVLALSPSASSSGEASRRPRPSLDRGRGVASLPSPFVSSKRFKSLMYWSVRPDKTEWKESDFTNGFVWLRRMKEIKAAARGSPFPIRLNDFTWLVSWINTSRRGNYLYGTSAWHAANPPWIMGAIVKLDTYYQGPDAASRNNGIANWCYLPP